MELLRDIQAGKGIAGIERLLNTGIDVNFKDNYGRTALHVSINSFLYTSGERLVLLNLLIKFGADVNARCSSGETPLMQLLSQQGDFDADCIKCLLNNNANVNLLAHSGITTLHFCLKTDTCRAQDEDVFKMLLKGFSHINLKNSVGTTLFIDFVRASCTVEKVKAMIEIGADVKCSDRFGNGILHYCTSSFSPPADLEVVETLIDCGADVNARNCQGVTPLLKFIKDNCDFNYMFLLLEKGADIFVTDNQRNNVLHYLSYNAMVQSNFDNRKRLLEYILNCGVDPNKKNSNDQTPLVLFLQSRRDISFVETLFMNGAYFNSESREELAAVNAYFMYCSRLVPVQQLNATLFKHMLLHDESFAKCNWFFMKDFLSGSEEVCPLSNQWCTKRSGTNDSPTIDSVSAITSELNKLKTVFIKDGLTLHKFCMQNNRRKLGSYFTFCNIDLIKLKLEFPNYFPVIEYKVALAQKWQHILERIKELPIWGITTPGEKEVGLSTDCLEYVMCFLSNRDLVNLSWVRK